MHSTDGIIHTKGAHEYFSMDDENATVLKYFGLENQYSVAVSKNE
jgi:hypothetical protein